MNLRSNGQPLLLLLALAGILLSLPSLSHALPHTTWDYSQTDCGCDEWNCDTWTWTITCTVTAGQAQQHRVFQTGVEILPNGVMPEAEITDAQGNPVFIDGALLGLVPDANVADKALAENGVSNPQHQWVGWRSNIPIPTSDGDSVDEFIVTYVFPAPVSPYGSGWFSDDSDDTLGWTVTDAYVRFLPTSPAIFNGLPFTALGQAELQVDAASGQLTVSNIGSSGLDGVSVDLGQAEGGGLNWSPPDPTLPPSAGIKVDAYGAIAGPDGYLGHVTVLKSPGPGGDIELTADFSPIGSPTYRLEVYDENGARVCMVQGAHDPVIAPTFPTGCNKGESRIPPPEALPPDWPWGPFPCFVLNWDEPQLLQLPGIGNACYGIEVRVIAENMNGPLNGIKRLNYFATEMVSLSCHDAFLVQDGAKCRGVDAAVITVDPDPTGGPGHRLKVSNLGSSGCDGVSIALGDEEIGHDFQWEPFFPLFESSITAEAYGTVNGQPGRLLGSTWFESVAQGEVVIHADYAPIAPQAYRLIFRVQDQIVHELLLPQFDVMLMGEVPDGCGKEFIYWPPFLCFIWDWELPLEILIPGQPPITADQVSILAVDALPYDALDRLVLMGGNLPNNELNILHQGRGIIPAVGDFPVENVGDAVLRSAAPDYPFMLDNLGSSGCDGVSIDLGSGPDPLDSFFLSHAPLGGPADHPQSAQVELRADGIFDPDPDDLCRYGGSLFLRNAGTGISLRPDYTPIESSTIVVVVENDGQVVAEFPGLPNNEELVLVPEFGSSCGKEIAEWPPGGGTLCFWIGFDQDVLIQVGPPGATAEAVTGDLVRVLAEDSPWELRELGFWEMLFTDIPVFLATEMRSGGATAVDELPLAMAPKLHAAYPNPFNPKTTLAFELARAGQTSLRIYDLGGRLVHTLVEGRLEPGAHSLSWDGRNDAGRSSASGLYFLRLQTPDGVSRQKITLLK